MFATITVVIDTSVWVSGVFFRGKPCRILAAWRDERFAVVYTPETLAEIEAKLIEKNAQFGGDPADVEGWLEYIKTYARLVPASDTVAGVCRDPDDDKFLDAAISGGADVLVSSDKDLQVLEAFQGVKILSPAGFLSLLTQILTPDAASDAVQSPL